MNVQKLCELYSHGCRVTRWIGARNIAFFGLLTTAIAVEYTSINKVSSGLSVLRHIMDSISSSE
jgi:hypothetical protein